MDCKCAAFILASSYLKDSVRPNHLFPSVSLYISNFVGL
jgi:hypothetical protein